MDRDHSVESGSTRTANGGYYITFGRHKRRKKAKGMRRQVRITKQLFTFFIIRTSVMDSHWRPEGERAPSHIPPGVSLLSILRSFIYTYNVYFFSIHSLAFFLFIP